MRVCENKKIEAFCGSWNMLGALIGDVVGSIYEFHNHRSKEFTFLADKATFTDDSVCSVALASALLTDKDPSVELQDWCRRYPGVGYGGMFRRWIYSSPPKPYDSYGNGAAMRVSGAAWLAGSLDEALSLAAKITEITHNHPEGMRGALATCHAIFLALKGTSARQIRYAVEVTYGYDLSQSVDKIRSAYHFDETCQGTVPQAITCALNADSFEDAIRNAISIGGDSDTIAAIAGSIAGPLFGIPKDIASQVLDRLPQEFCDVVIRTQIRNAELNQMRVRVIRNNVPLEIDGNIPLVAIMGNLEFDRAGKVHINLFLANPDDIPEEPYQVQMGYTFDQLTCPQDFIPANDLERAENASKLFSTRLDLLPDEILPWTWPDNRWKVSWLIEHGVATETGKFHIVASYPIPILKLTPSFFGDCMSALGMVFTLPQSQ